MNEYIGPIIGIAAFPVFFLIILELHSKNWKKFKSYLKNRFPIPPFNTMHLLHGVLIWTIVWYLFTYLIVWLAYDNPTAPQVDLIKAKLILCLFGILPILVFFHLIIFGDLLKFSPTFSSSYPTNKCLVTVILEEGNHNYSFRKQCLNILVDRVKNHLYNGEDLIS